MSSYPMTDEKIFDALEHNGARIWEITDNLSEGELLQSPHEGGWSIAEILPYLHEGAWMAGNDAHRILSEDNPTIPSYEDIMDEAGNVKYHPPDEVPALLEELDTMNKQMAALLRGLRSDEWERTARHRGHGTVTLPQLLAYHLNDQGYYVERMKEIAAEVRGSHAQLVDLFAASCTSVGPGDCSALHT